MFESLAAVADVLRAAIAELDGTLMTGRDAAGGLRAFAEIERLAASGRTLLAARVEETKAWDGELPVTSAAEWIAQVSGTNVGAAIGLLEASKELASQPVVADAVRAGSLSPSQAALVVGAVRAAPEQAASLIATAQRSTFKDLADTCRALKARADDPAARAKRHRENRRGYFCDDPDGMVEMHARWPVGQGGMVRAAVEKRTDQIFRQRHRDGAEEEPRQRYMADAIAELVCEGVIDLNDAKPGVKKKRRNVRVDMQVRVDLAALRRGSVEPGEICDAPGVGELTVEEARELLAMDDTVITALLTRGTEVLRVVRNDRTVITDVKSALDFTNPYCVVPGCTRHFRKEKDHTAQGGYAGTRRTKLDELANLCDPHHTQKTLFGWILEPDPTEPKGWSFRPPPEPKARTG